MATRVRRITPEFLKNLIVKEARRIQKETLETGVKDPKKVKAQEVDADEYADTLEKELDHMKALKIHEQKLLNALQQVREAKTRIQKKNSRRSR